MPVEAQGGDEVPAERPVDDESQGRDARHVEEHEVSHVLREAVVFDNDQGKGKTHSSWKKTIEFEARRGRKAMEP